MIVSLIQIWELFSQRNIQIYISCMSISIISILGFLSFFLISYALFFILLESIFTRIQVSFEFSLTNMVEPSKYSYKMLSGYELQKYCVLEKYFQEDVLVNRCSY